MNTHTTGGTYMGVTPLMHVALVELSCADKTYVWAWHGDGVAYSEQRSPMARDKDKAPMPILYP